jgi:hypothetical protein
MDEFDTLEALAASADQNPNAPAPAGVVASADAVAEPLPPGPDEQALDLVNAFAGFVVGYAPDTATIWTEEARGRSAAALAPLMIKYNISLMAIPPELTAAIIVGPLLYRSATIVAEKIKADRVAAAAAARPGASTRQAVEAAEPAAIAPGATESGAGPAVPVHPQMALYKP